MSPPPPFGCARLDGFLAGYGAVQGLVAGLIVLAIGGATRVR